MNRKLSDLKLFKNQLDQEIEQIKVEIEQQNIQEICNLMINDHSTKLWILSTRYAKHAALIQNILGSTYNLLQQTDTYWRPVQSHIDLTQIRQFWIAKWVFRDYWDHWRYSYQGLEIPKAYQDFDLIYLLPSGPCSLSQYLQDCNSYFDLLWTDHPIFDPNLEELEIVQQPHVWVNQMFLQETK